ncbi:MAG: glycoside hydrolase family 5 protein [Ruminococcus sp.]|nr:glycoside hydrolase family 5 protein [Ruminococcus sp.]
MTAVERYGALRVEGTRLLGEHGEQVRLYGVSTHGLAWRSDVVCREAFEALRDEWHINTVRLALYTHEYHGYCTDGDKEELKALVFKGIDLAVELGLYVIVDWHVLGEFSPLIYADEAVKFFDELSSRYAGCPNLLYEICNEPNGTSDWGEIREYATRVIPVIRRNAPDSVVIVGTPEWSQRCDLAAADPLGFKNLLYAFHFYAATHFDNLRQRLRRSIEAGLPMFISECSITEASGHGDLDFVSARAWFALLDEYHLGYICWSFSASPEESGVIKCGCSKLSGWTDDDLKRTGHWFKHRFLSEEEQQGK